MCLTCVYQQSSNTGCIVLVISPVLSTILLDVTIGRCLSPSVNGTYILYGYDKRDNGERSLKYAVVKEFMVDWKQSYSSIDESLGNHGNKICIIILLAYLEITQSSSVISSLTFNNMHPSNNVKTSTG